jgi:hypothetical protein
MRRGMLQANKEAYMGRKGILAVIVGAIILGAVIGYGVRQSALGAVVGAAVGAAIVAVGIGLSVVVVPFEVWGFLAAFGQQIVTCCSFFGVLSLASIVTLGGLLLWHSLALAALAGVGMMTVLLVVLSAMACSNRDASPVQ